MRSLDRHWPVGLVYDTLVASLPPSSVSLPLQVTVHLAPPPMEQLLLLNDVTVCRDAFMSQVSAKPLPIDNIDSHLID